MLHKPKHIDRPLKPLAEVLADFRAEEAQAQEQSVDDFLAGRPVQWAAEQEAARKAKELPGYFYLPRAKLTWFQRWAAWWNGV